MRLKARHITLIRTGYYNDDDTYIAVTEKGKELYISNFIDNARLCFFE